jgi:NADH:ubiquinone oxidoreductase subunit 5 (subunit L)/multisubunit Na+/H+ antiporter MnhA subunit
VGSYKLVQRGVLARSWWPFGLGALFAAMSLAAMPPQAGFVSEWYLFQTFFQGFHLNSLASRLTMALAGAGLALTVAIAFATFIKVFGIGLLGRSVPTTKRVPAATSCAVGILGLLVLATAVAMPVLLDSLSDAITQRFGADTIQRMHVGALLVPATGAPIRIPDTFAFISPSLLVLVMPLLAIVPIGLLLGSRRFAVRRAEVWYGGRNEHQDRSATTALTFSNALRTFYSFIYRPTDTTEHELTHESTGHPYFVRKLIFSHDVAPIFGPYLFAPLERLVISIARRLRLIQSGHLNLYLAFIGALLVIILIIALF